MGTYSGQGDYAELMELIDTLQETVQHLRESGTQLAYREMNYRKALRLRILDERNNKTPVTIISDICRGDPNIAELKRARDCAEAIYKADLESINATKTVIRVIENQIDREWSTTK